MASPYIPEATGGIESSIHELCLLLKKARFEPAVLARFRKRAWPGYRHAVRRRLGIDGHVVCSEPDGYPVFRSANPLRDAESLAARFRPDIAVVQRGRMLQFIETFQRLRIPVLAYLRNAEFSAMSDRYPAGNTILYVANSEFTADAFRREVGLSAQVLPPIVDPARYRVESSREAATFVNPVPIKGLDIALSLAEARPDIPFLFVESWPLKARDRRNLSHRIAGLTNVTLVGRTEDMRSVYGHTRVLLVPSVWNEAWGRVVTEAQISGIPVLASRVGGLPQAVGEGGLLVAPDAAITDWAQALGLLWDNPDVYAEHCRRAARRATLPDVDYRNLIETFIAMIERHARSGFTCRH